MATDEDIKVCVVTGGLISESVWEEELSKDATCKRCYCRSVFTSQFAVIFHPHARRGEVGLPPGSGAVLRRAFRILLNRGQRLAFLA
ncbi:hypothetical protein NDU88_004724 [Pleurodeles waltl]|uniref:Uncharacterized protein n=1 Tax=Pleurodeles waltl TaxID=8319 RepID=A0AAV7MA27_PLEWA|nr:hypothetical protein NDU88_004724 [Pleurodeles waltl]